MDFLFYIENNILKLSYKLDEISLFHVFIEDNNEAPNSEEVGVVEQCNYLFILYLDLFMNICII